QSLFLSSVGFFKWIERSYPSFRKKTGYDGPSLLPQAHRMRNFIITGSIDKPDAKQKKESAGLLRDILHERELPRNYFKTMLDSLLEDEVKGQILPEMQPRMKWLREMIQAYGEIRKASPVADAKDPLNSPLHSMAASLVVYLGTGEGSLDEALKYADSAALLLRKGKRDPSALYTSVISSLKKSGGSDFFKNSKDGLERLKRAQEFFEEAVRQHRGDLVGLSAKEALGQSLFFKVQDALASGALIDSVKEEMKDAKMGDAWLKDLS